MKWSWELRPAAEREMKKLDRRVIADVLDALDLLAHELSENGRPIQADTKKLKGLSDEFRLRYGVEFREVKDPRGEVIAEGSIVVYRVANRREVY